MLLHTISAYALLSVFLCHTSDIVSKENMAVTSQNEAADLAIIPFSFKDKKLIDIINDLQKLKNINIILPQGNDAILSAQTVSFTTTENKPITIQAAWEMLITFLSMAGYSMLENNNFYSIVKNDQKIASQIIPIYITPVDQLPYSEQQVRFLYYFKNLKIAQESIKSSIENIFKEILAANSMILFEPKANAVIITGKADLIASAMHIIAELDKSGFKQTIEVLPLFHATAQTVKTIFDQLSLAASDSKQQPNLRDDTKTSESSYFAEGTVIQADSRTNRLILMGKKTTITRIKEFIIEHIDIEPQSGKSILHIIDLQYLNAQEFAKTLDMVMAQKIPKNQSNNQATNVHKFNPVIIRAEPEISLNETVLDIQAGRVIENAVTLADSVYSGGNRIIVAALDEDWQMINELVKKLDKPQKQVICEVFIADIRANKDKILAGTNRNLLDCGIDTGVDFLASHISNVNTVLPATATTLASDLLELDSNVAEPNIADTVAPGSLVVSFNESCVGIWGLLQILDSLVDVNVISHPHLVVLNNGTGKIKVAIVRRALGATFINNNTPVTPFEDITADIILEIKPQINAFNQILLEVFVEISEFVVPLNARDVTIESSDNQVNRRLRSCAQMNNGQMLILGGLNRDTETKILTQTPILARIPFIGQFFKRERAIIEHLNLAVFIIPTVVEPKLRDGQTMHTEHKLLEARQEEMSGNFFESYKDPITRFFFSNQFRDGNLEIDEYISRSNNIDYINPKIITRKKYENSVTQSEQIKSVLANEDNPLLNYPIMKPTKI